MPAAIVGAGVTSGILSYVYARTDPTHKDVGFVIGAVIGGTLFWPAIALGVFSLWKRFRNPRSQGIILLSTWCICILGVATSISSRAKARALHKPGQNLVETLESGWIRRADGGASPLPINGNNVRIGGTAEHSEGSKSPPTDAQRATAAAFDFSTGSDERLIKTIESAQEDRYHAIVAAYRAACAVHPDDTQLAVERLRFISHFANAEDYSIGSSDSDYQEAERYLDTAFAGTAPAILFHLERTYGAEFAPKAAQYEHLVASWPREAAARYWLLRAEHYDEATHDADVRDAAEKSFKLHPTFEAGIRLADSLNRLKSTQRANEVLSHEVFKTAPDWVKKQRMDLLFAVKATNQAMDAFKELKQRNPGLVTEYAVANELARAGQLGAARDLLSALKSQRWNAQRMAREHFNFELEFGDRSSATQAYRDFRKFGYQTDPFLRERFSLFLRHPTAGISWTDVLGLVVLVMIVMVLALAPWFVLLPVHYWSLHRERRGFRATWSASPWGLGTAWALATLTLTTNLAGTWYYAPDALRHENGRSAAAAVTGPQIVSIMTWEWVVLAAAALLLVWHRHAWRILSGGVWGWRRAVGMGLLAALALRIGAGLYLLLVPMAKTPLAQVAPGQLATMKAAYAAMGPTGLLALIGVFVPLLEETVFRGMLLGAFARHIPWIAANSLQAACFAALHENLWLAPFYFAFGYVAGELMRRSGSLLPSLAMHCANNVIVCLGVLFLNTTKGILTS